MRNWRQVRVFAVLMLAASAWGAAVAAKQTPAAESTAQAPAMWFCPMHPDVTATFADRCSKCGMAMISGDPFETREYHLDVSAVPAAPRPGEPVKLTFRIVHPVSGKPITAFETVHDKRFHLFLISQDMQVFEHIHPELQPDGRWTIEVVLPKPGYYRLLADFLPTGGSPQFLGRTLVTKGFEGDLASVSAKLEPDPVLRTTAGGMTIIATLEPQTLIAGQYAHITYTLTDEATGAPVTDLQPYLGAFGHALILSEDMADYVHSHPVDQTPEILKTGGGPQISFEGYMPRPGMYRAWTQFQRHGTVITVPFTVRVKSLTEAVRAGL